MGATDRSATLPQPTQPRNEASSRSDSEFAVGDPTLRRIHHKHLETRSPYNTYQIVGLPPGPIRIPEKSALDAVLNAPENPYLYMCAKEDFSGYHNFARDLATHNANARRYQAALNRLNIK
ncbi:MAG: endolytic transglycosylase MltG [Bacteroidales bacterium]|nr:endolytic transglycosylase MltG [Bacteroidales bacterium]